MSHDSSDPYRRDARARFLAEAMPQKVWTADRHGNVDYFNRHWLDYTGLSFEELRDWGWKQIIHPDDWETNQRVWRHSIDTGVEFQLEHRFRRSDGEYRWHLSRGLAHRDENGDIVMWVGTNTDIDEQKRTQAELRESEERYRSLAEATTDIIWTTNAAGEFVTEQPDWAEFAGQTFEEYRGWGWLDAIHPDDRGHTGEVWAAAVRDRTVCEVEYRARRHDGEYRWFEVRAAPVLGSDGSIREWVGVGTDVSERKRTEEELLGRAREAALSAAVGIALTRGGSLRDVLQQSTEAIVEHLDAAFARIWTVDETEQMLLLQASAGMYTHLDGPHSRIPVGAFKIGRIAQERQPHLTNDVPNDPRVSDKEWARREGMVAFAGYPLVVDDQTVGVMAMFARQPLHQATLERLGAIADGVAVAIEKTRLFQEAEEARDLAQQNAAELEMQAAELEEAQVEMEMINDELQRANAELQQKTEEAERARAAAAEANQSKSDFLANMSHELRTPLNAIGGYTELLEMELRGPLTEAQREDLRRIRRSQNYLLSLINDVLNFAKLDAGHVHFDIVDLPLDSAIDAVEELVSQQVESAGLSYTYRRCDPALTARADPEKVRQVLLNLLTNAVKFTGAGGSITVSCEAQADRVAVFVRDTGMGIPEDKLAQIFEPFVQVDRRLYHPAEGTGLGLAISRDLARGMGGDLRVESAVGEGSTFTFFLPR